MGTGRSVRPNGAYKLLTILLYYDVGPREPGVAPVVALSHETGMEGYLEIPSVRRLARILGTESKRVNKWFVWLAEQGYLHDLAWNARSTAAYVRIRQPRRVHESG